MNTLILLLTTACFYAWYCTTTRISVAETIGTESWSAQYGQWSKGIGSLLGLVAIILAVAGYGIVAGLLLFFICLVMAASIIIFIAPMGIMTRFGVGIFFLVLALIEFLA